MGFWDTVEKIVDFALDKYQEANGKVQQAKAMSEDMSDQSMSQLENTIRNGRNTDVKTMAARYAYSQREDEILDEAADHFQEKYDEAVYGKKYK